MSHGPITEWKEDGSSEYKTKLGVIMFLLYVIVYIGFILLNTLDPKLMGIDVLKVNLAIVYGIGLIVYALILAIIYNFLCTKKENEMAVINKAKEEIK
ncbi:MAG: DUF485 domain-containing protein [Firmicutes bacterium]|nr:DUF485 domain-containing protein [Bacillota bacterium]